jgi:hypothetical protein
LINVDPAALGRVFFRDLGEPTFNLGIFDRQTSELNANTRARAPGATLIARRTATLERPGWQ